MYVYCMYLSWRHGRTAPWPSCLSRLKNLIKKKEKKRMNKVTFISDNSGLSNYPFSDTEGAGAENVKTWKSQQNVKSRNVYL